MKHKNINSLQNLYQIQEDQEDIFLFFYKSGTQQSECALKNIENINFVDPIPLFSVNVAKVKDVHPAFNITSAPIIIEVKKGKAGKQLKGCHQESALKSFFITVGGLDISKKENRQKKVIVYTTPTCSWCKTLKNYLISKDIKFREIDVSRDEKAAREMIKRSGQQGVPQSLINGHVVFGFDRNKINNLLEINS